MTVLSEKVPHRWNFHSDEYNKYGQAVYQIKGMGTQGVTAQYQMTKA